MTVLKVLIAPNPLLYIKTEPVLSITDEVRQQLKDMRETMYADRGIGLSANQVGILKRMIVMDVGDDNSLTRDPEPITPELFYFINPEIEWVSDKKIVFEEGCLSVPGLGVLVKRPDSVRISYLDENGIEKTRLLHGLQARCIQHEIDHINGKTTLEYLSRLKKEMALKKVMKYYSS